MQCREWTDGGYIGCSFLSASPASLLSYVLYWRRQCPRVWMNIFRWVSITGKVKMFERYSSCFKKIVLKESKYQHINYKVRCNITNKITLRKTWRRSFTQTWKQEKQLISERQSKKKKTTVGLKGRQGNKALWAVHPEWTAKNGDILILKFPFNSPPTTPCVGVGGGGHDCSACRGQKEASDPLELEIKLWHQQEWWEALWHPRLHLLGHLSSPMNADTSKEVPVGQDKSIILLIN